jgi:hypothetical protein
MTWHYQNNEVIDLPEDIVGFVYKITNLTNNRKYIGKKLAKFSKTKTRVVKLKSGEKKKKKIRTKEESDWREYWSSSEELKKDVAEFGEENFKREILHYCYSKGSLSYMELREQMDNKVLESDDWYNGIIQVRIHKSHIKEKID